MVAGFRSPLPLGLAAPAVAARGGFRLPVPLGIAVVTTSAGFRAPWPFALLGVTQPPIISIVLPADGGGYEQRVAELRRAELIRDDEDLLVILRAILSSGVMDA